MDVCLYYVLQWLHWEIFSRSLGMPRNLYVFLKVGSIGLSSVFLVSYVIIVLDGTKYI